MGLRIEEFSKETSLLPFIVLCGSLGYPHQEKLSIYISGCKLVILFIVMRNKEVGDGY